MNMSSHGFKSREEGKGSLGCIFALFLMVVALLLAFKLGPPYKNHYEFKSDMKQAVSRAGARSMTDENIKKDLIQIAEKNMIVLKSENIQIRHMGGQVVITVEYTIPVNFLIMTKDLRFNLEESSWTST